MIRETVYRCTCRSGDSVRTAHVRAWDAREAEDLFVRELRIDGVTRAVDVRVERARAAAAQQGLAALPTL